MAGLLHRWQVHTNHNTLDYSAWIDGHKHGRTVGLPDISPRAIASLLGVDLSNDMCVCVQCEAYRAIPEDDEETDAKGSTP